MAPLSIFSMDQSLKDSSHLSDHDLVRSANNGSEEAMKTLYYKYRDWVYALAWRYCGNQEDAQDILQEVFAYFFNKFPGFKLRSKLKTFLYPVVKNISLNHIRKRSRVVPLDQGFADSIPDNARSYGLEWKKLNEQLEGLPAEDQELILLRFFDGFTLKELAEILKVPLGTVKSRLHRTLSRLRDHISR